MKKEALKLCGGTFFSLLLQVKKRKAANPDCLKMLVRIFTQVEPRFEKNTFTNNTSLYKNCNCDYTEWLSFNEDKYVRQFDKRVREEYLCTLLEMDKFARSFLNFEDDYKAEIEWLVSALLELISCDESIPDLAEFYINENGKPSNKRDILLNHSVFSLQPFLLGIWHFVVVNVSGNQSGKKTLEKWFEYGEKHTKGRFSSTIGECCFKHIKVNILDTIVPNKNLNNEVIYENQNNVSEKSSTDILNEKILASGKAIADTYLKVVDALVSMPVKKVLYVGSMVADNEVSALKENAIEVIDLNDGTENLNALNSSTIYKYSGMIYFKSKFDECMNRYVELISEIRNIEIKSNTSFDNWKSKSYANNILSAGDYECTVWFKIISSKDEKYVVQIMIMEEG